MLTNCRASWLTIGALNLLATACAVATPVGFGPPLHRTNSADELSEDAGDPPTAPRDASATPVQDAGAMGEVDASADSHPSDAPSDSGTSSADGSSSDAATDVSDGNAPDSEAGVKDGGPTPISLEPASEPNESNESATRLGALVEPVVYRAQIAPAGASLDYDWFRFAAGSTGTVTVALTPAAGAGPLEMSLIAGAPLELLGRGAGIVTLRAALAPGQVFFVAVYGATGSGTVGSGAYTLAMNP